MEDNQENVKSGMGILTLEKFIEYVEKSDILDSNKQIVKAVISSFIIESKQED